MDEPKTVLFPVWKELVKAACEWEYGSAHSHEEISQILGIKYGTKEYYDSVSAAKDELAELGHRIMNVRDEGYYKLAVSEYPEAAYNDTKKSVRTLKTGLNNVMNAPTKAMDDRNKRRTENITVFMGKTYVSLVSSASEIKELAGIKRPQRMLTKAAGKKED